MYVFWHAILCCCIFSLLKKKSTLNIYVQFQTLFFRKLQTIHIHQIHSRPKNSVNLVPTLSGNSGRNPSHYWIAMPIWYWYRLMEGPHMHKETWKLTKYGWLVNHPAATGTEHCRFAPSINSRPEWVMSLRGIRQFRLFCSVAVVSIIFFFNLTTQMLFHQSARPNLIIAFILVANLLYIIYERNNLGNRECQTNILLNK